MKIVYLIPLLTAALILSSCFGSKEEDPAPEVPNEPTAAESAEGGETTPAEIPEAAVDSSDGDASTPDVSGKGPTEPVAGDAPVPGDTPVDPDTSADPDTSGPVSAASTPGEPVADGEADPAAVENVFVMVSTSAGDITIELFAKESPESVANFLTYAKEGYYDNTVFHRVIKGFMVQGGGFGLEEGGAIKQKETKDPVQNEAKNGLKNARGTVAMARTSAPHSATSQFFINHADNSNLDYPSFDGWGYAVFGKVTKGMDVVDAIAEMPTGSQSLVTKVGPRPMKDVPSEPIVIKSIKVSE